MKGSRLRAKGEKIVFDTEEGKKVFELRPLKNKQFLEVLELADKKEGLKSSMLMAKYCLNEDPKIKNKQEDAFDDEEMEDMPAPFLFQIMKVAARINGLEELFDFQLKGQEGQLAQESQPDSKKGILDRNLEALNRNPAKTIS